MSSIEFTSQLAQHVDCPPVQSVAASSLGEALESVFQDYPKLRGYVLDDLGSIRKHITVFVDGEMLPSRDDLHVPLSPNSEVFVMQAVAGG